MCELERDILLNLASRSAFDRRAKWRANIKNERALARTFIRSRHQFHALRPRFAMFHTAPSSTPPPQAAPESLVPALIFSLLRQPKKLKPKGTNKY